MDVPNLLLALSTNHKMDSESARACVCVYVAAKETCLANHTGITLRARARTSIVLVSLPGNGVTL